MEAPKLLGSADCTPREMRLTPLRRRRAMERQSTLSGLHSTVISAWRLTVNNR